MTILSRRSCPAPTPHALSPLAERLRRAGIGTFFRPGQVIDAGLTRDQLRTLVRRGQLEHVARGLYRLREAEPTENEALAMASARVPDGIVCLLSALVVHEIIDHQPAAVWLALPQRARRPRLRKPPVRFVRFSGAAIRAGITDTAFEGVAGRITTPERTVVDCFRFRRLLGPELPMEALRNALQRDKTTPADLLRVDEVLPSRRLRAALEMIPLLPSFLPTDTPSSVHLCTRRHPPSPLAEPATPVQTQLPPKPQSRYGTES